MGFHSVAFQKIQSGEVCAQSKSLTDSPLTWPNIHFALVFENTSECKVLTAILDVSPQLACCTSIEILIKCFCAEWRCNHIPRIKSDEVILTAMAQKARMPPMRCARETQRRAELPKVRFHIQNSCSGACIASARSQGYLLVEKGTSRIPNETMLTRCHTSECPVEESEYRAQATPTPAPTPA